MFCLLYFQRIDSILNRQSSTFRAMKINWRSCESNESTREKVNRWKMCKRKRAPRNFRYVSRVFMTSREKLPGKTCVKKDCYFFFGFSLSRSNKRGKSLGRSHRQSGRYLLCSRGRAKAKRWAEGNGARERARKWENKKNKSWASRARVIEMLKAVRTGFQQ